MWLTRRFEKSRPEARTSYHRDKRKHCRATQAAATRLSSGKKGKTIIDLRFLSNSRVVLQHEGEMIYVDLISPLWWQTYDPLINGQLEKRENYWRDLWGCLCSGGNKTTCLQQKWSSLTFPSFSTSPSSLSLPPSWKQSRKRISRYCPCCSVFCKF